MAMDLGSITFVVDIGHSYFYCTIQNLLSHLPLNGRVYVDKEQEGITISSVTGHG